MIVAAYKMFSESILGLLIFSIRLSMKRILLAASTLTASILIVFTIASSIIDSLIDSLTYIAGI